MNGMQSTDDYCGGLGCYSRNLQLLRVTAFRCDRIRRAGKSLLAPQERRGNRESGKSIRRDRLSTPAIDKGCLDRYRRG